MAVVICTKCEWQIQQCELWDEKTEEHFEETGHMVFLTLMGEHLPGSDV